MFNVFFRFLPIIFIVGAIATTILLVSSREKPQRKAIKPPVPIVSVVNVEMQSTEFTVSSQGLVSPKFITLLSSQVSGRVDWVSEKFIEGGMFNKGDTLIQLEKFDYITDVKQAEAELARAQASLQEEVARGKVAEVEWNTISNSVAPELGLRKPQLANEQANVMAAEARLERAKRNLSRTTITAPFDGIVKLKNVEVGQFIGVGAQLGTLFDTRVAQIRLPLKQDDYAYLQLDDNAGIAKTTVTLDANVAGRAQQWLGKITRDEGLVDDQSRVMFAVAEVIDPYKRNSESTHSVLKFGTFVGAQIDGKRVENMVRLPRSSVRIDNSVVLVDDEFKLQTVAVDVVKTGSDYVLISNGLTAGQRVVSSTLASPRNGVVVKISGQQPADTLNAVQKTESAKEVTQ